MCMRLTHATLTMSTFPTLIAIEPNEHTATFLNIQFDQLPVACCCDIWSDTNFQLYNLK